LITFISTTVFSVLGEYINTFHASKNDNMQNVFVIHPIYLTTVTLLKPLDIVHDLVTDCAHQRHDQTYTGCCTSNVMFHWRQTEYFITSFTVFKFGNLLMETYCMC